MNERQKEKQPPSAGLTPEDIYFVLFRRKWLILGGSAAGILAAAGVYLTMPKMYVSEAKIAVPYVLETKMPSGNSD